MSESIQKINQISDHIKNMNFDEENINLLKEDITLINNLDLSSEYDDYKKMEIKRIEYIIQYINAVINNDENIEEMYEKCKSIDTLDNLEKAFKQAGVKCFRSEKGLTYYYERK